MIDVEGLRTAITAAIDALADVADQLPEPDREPSPANPTPPRQADRRVNTTLRLEPELLEQLKIVAARKRVRVNDLLLDGVRHVLALHGERAA